MPKYIQQRQKEVAKAQEEYDRYIEETMRQGALLRISNEERYGITCSSLLYRSYAGMRF